jgi:predicted ferric reductase
VSVTRLPSSRNASRSKPTRQAEAWPGSTPARLGTAAARGTAPGRGFVRRMVATAIASVAMGVLLVTLGIWLQGGGINGVHTSSDALTSVGRLTGLLAGLSLLLQLLLMARLPFVEFAFGWARTSAWHKLNGKICLGLVVVHVSLVIWGYAAATKVSIPTEVSQMVTRLYGMWPAVIATVAMVVVVGTSLVIMRKRLRYEFWYLVHLLAYATVVLAWFHQIPTSTLFVGNPMATAFWTAVFVGTLQFVILFRFGQPVFRTFWHRMRVAQVRDEGAGAVSITISGRHLEWFNAQAGQFFIWRFLAPGFWTEAHPFSLSTAPGGDSFRITVKGIGDFTKRLKALPAGTRVVAEGPFGAFTQEARKHERVAMIAGGIGITPIRSLLEEIKGKVVIIYRVVHEEEAHLRRELDALAEKSGATIHYVTGDHRDRRNQHLLSAKHLKSLVPDIAQRDVYICGPPVMMRMVTSNVKTLGVRDSSIHTDTFSL